MGSTVTIVLVSCPTLENSCEMWPGRQTHTVLIHGFHFGHVRHDLSTGRHGKVRVGWVLFWHDQGLCACAADCLDGPPRDDLVVETEHGSPI
jgi:hypothetical protein